MKFKKLDCKLIKVPNNLPNIFQDKYVSVL